jgi:hypothetical protein
MRGFWRIGQPFGTHQASELLDCHFVDGDWPSKG